MRLYKATFTLFAAALLFLAGSAQEAMAQHVWKVCNNSNCTVDITMELSDGTMHFFPAVPPGSCVSVTQPSPTVFLHAIWVNGIRVAPIPAPPNCVPLTPGCPWRLCGIPPMTSDLWRIF